jgi:poly(hydroxyalkanoate) depolymerase family esterase
MTSIGDGLLRTTIDTFRPVLVIGALYVLLASSTSPSFAQTFLNFTDQAPPYRLFLPAGPELATPLSLVVMLHGCEQDSLVFAEVTNMNALAAEHGFVVAYPEQTTHPRQCWQWYEPGHQSRGDGEPAAIVSVVDAVTARDDVTIDPSRIYIAGLSAGASMATIVATTYPDVFAALGVVAGVPFGGADDCFGAFNAMQRISARMLTLDAFAAWADYWRAYWACSLAGNINPFLPAVPAPDTLGEQALQAMGDNRSVVPVIVFQGLADETVRPENGWDVVSQWAQTNDLASDGVDDDVIDDVPETETPGSAPGGHGLVERSYADDRGNEVIRSYMIEDMAHAWPGGLPDRDYSDPAGPDASGLMWIFFSTHPKTL